MKLVYRVHFLLLMFSGTVFAADIVPNEIMMPGTQPNEVGSFESPDKCDNCHAGYNVDDLDAEPTTGWRGAAMGNAGRDPVFWATLAIAEQDFDGAGDLCIRCHSAKGWYGGRSTPTDGSGLASNGDENGIDCDTCHASTNTDNSDPVLQGVMIPPFVANCNGDSAGSDPAITKCDTGEGFYGSGMLSLWPQVNEKLGPYAENDAEARHQFAQSAWHRHPDFCGTCHDVSNSAVGDLAPGNGAQPGNPHSVVSSWDLGLTNDEGIPIPELGGAIENKAAFNNPPYAYGVVERTFSEYKSSPLWEMSVSEFPNLPDDLKVAGGSLDVTYQAALAASNEATANGGNPGDYADGTPRTFSCQSCHMRPVGGDGAPGCNKNGAPVRKDLPRHDHTGGNYWFASMAQYQDNVGTLRVGDGLNSTQLLAMDLGQKRAVKHLTEAGSLSIENGGNILKVTNLTGHKLITGYPEGRRMWLNIKWYDVDDNPIDEYGEYGSLDVSIDLDGDGQAENITVETILDLDDADEADTRIYEAHYAMTQEWANVLLVVGYSPDMALSYDRETGAVDYTLGQLAAQDPGTYHETFHFALNNHVSKDNRIPPYEMNYVDAQKRNTLPVPADQYGMTFDQNGNPLSSTYEYWDEIDLNVIKPSGAVSATIDLLYQGTTWEYIQFLKLANNGQNAFLGDQGDAMFDAWFNGEVRDSLDNPIDLDLDGDSDPTTGVGIVLNVNGDYNMVPPVVMASIDWGTPPTCKPTPGQEKIETFCQDGIDNDCDGSTDSADSDCNGPGNTAPTCVIDEPAGDITIDEGGSVNYAGTATDPDVGDVLSYSWTFEGGSPASSPDEDPGLVSYDTSGVYDTTFTATDGEASCTPETVTITVQGAGGMCSDYADETTCVENDCEWGGKGKNKTCQEPPPPSVCDELNETNCNAEATCRWNKKQQVCVTR